MSTETSLAIAADQEEDSLALAPVSNVQAAMVRLNALQTFVSNLMKQGEDFGTIPGTKKPTLYKPGAEKLLELYGLAASYEVTHRVEEWERGFWHYEVKCTIRSRRRGDVVGEGVGSCNSYEEKYRWRTEWSDDQPRGEGWERVIQKGGRIAWKRRGENENRWDLVNTILKMAKKRSLIDGALSVTRSSGLFTQDIEDMPRHLVSGDAPEHDSGDGAHQGRAEEESRPCPTCGGGMTLRSGVTRDGRPWTAWMCDAKCGQKPLWLPDRPTHSDAAPAEAVADAGARIITHPAAQPPPPAEDRRILGDVGGPRCAAAVRVALTQQGFSAEEAQDWITARLTELGRDFTRLTVAEGAALVKRANDAAAEAEEAAAAGAPEGSN